MAEEIHEVVIIGSGPAGLTAAIYTARASLSPILIEGTPSSTSDQPGGQLMLTTDVENYPGFPEGIMGPDLMSNFRSQAIRFGTSVITDKASRVEFSTDGKSPHKIWLAEKSQDDADKDDAGNKPHFLAKAVIVSTGAQSVMLGLEKENGLIGRGVSTCATCDGFFYKDQDIAVVGGGDSAMEEATFLTKFASSVSVIHRRDQLRASKIMADRAMANEKIKFLWNREVSDLVGDEKLSGIKLRDTQTGEDQDLPVTGLFIAIGHTPNTGIFKGQLEMKESGYLITQPGSTKTSIEGVFACGDVQDDYYRQAITAAGSGCMAAIDAEHWLQNSA